MEKIALILKLSTWIGIPAYVVYYGNILLNAGGFDDVKSIVLFIIAACSGLLFLGGRLLKFIKELMDTDDAYTAWKDRKEKHSKQHSQTKK